LSQPHKPARRRAIQTRAAFVDRYATANREAAAIIAADPKRYAGLPLTWAVMVLQGEARTAPAWGLVA
jgi:hypothetical protein